ncbi:MAG: methionyl-tRNA formyltransferase [Acidobacteria bacterium]|nr:methionyl-tRNA formyltransferase [Acidobacteriota bacterium]
MRVVFLGTPSFAVPALRMLIQHSYEICGVFTQPDRPSGRGQKLQPGPVKLLAQEKGIPVFQPPLIRNEENRKILADIGPDFIVTAAYGQILPSWILHSARIAPVNIHASLLPRYRGAAPVAWAILNGESVTGVTTMLMNEGLDSGPILMQREVPIPFEITAGELAEKISMVGANLLIDTLDGLHKGIVNPIPQDENKVCWAPRMTKDRAQISWDKSARDIHNQIRGMNPWPIAQTLFQEQNLRIWRSMPVDQAGSASAKPGMLLDCTKSGILVQCGEETVLEILRVQLPAKSVVSGREFANGARLNPGKLVFQ